MSIKDSTAIPVFNYNNYNVCLVTNIQTYILTPSVDNIPTLATLSFAEINYVNSRSDCFRTGELFFDKDVENEVYKALSIDKEKIISNEEIEDIVLHPTLVGLQKLIDIKTESTFSRVRSVLVGLRSTNSYDISERVTKIIETRFSEFKRNILSTRIQLQAKDTVSVNNAESLAEVKLQNETLQLQLAEMQKMMSQLLANKNTPTETTKTETVAKRGRPKITKTK